MARCPVLIYICDDATAAQVSAGLWNVVHDPGRRNRRRVQPASGKQGGRDGRRSTGDAISPELFKRRGYSRACSGTISTTRYIAKPTSWGRRLAKRRQGQRRW